MATYNSNGLISTILQVPSYPTKFLRENFQPAFPLPILFFSLWQVSLWLLDVIAILKGDKEVLAGSETQL